MSIRDNLLVTIGNRAAYMDMRGSIELPVGSREEDILSAFAVKLAELLMKEQPDLMSFDEFIETELEKRFPKEKPELVSFYEFIETELEKRVPKEQ